MDQPLGSACCQPNRQDDGVCRVESLLSIDERGQMVLPKEIRERAGLQAGDKLALISWERAGRVCCISLVKAEELTGMVKELLGPMLQQIANNDQVKEA